VAKPLAVVPELEAELDALYGLPPGEFTEARNDLARRLKQAGQEEAAARVKQLRKPTVPLWAVNQLARKHTKDVQALVAAGDRLRTAQEQALRGGESDELRAATAEERRLIRGLTQQGEQLVREAGHAAAAERIAATLRSAAINPEAREVLAKGRLSEDIESSGFDAFAGMEVPTKPRTRGKGSAKAAAKAADRRQERIRTLRERATSTTEEADQGEHEADRLEKAAREARKRADRLRQRAERAQAELEAAEPEE
jgi:hypothetical protein